MDTTTASTIGGADDTFLFSAGYVSCMKVDGQPILPPLMTEKRREEMRRYKEQAITREKELQERRTNETFQVSKSSKSSAQKQSAFAQHLAKTCISHTDEQPKSRDSRSVSTSPTPGIPATSTPRACRAFNLQEQTKNTIEHITSPTILISDSSNVPEGVLRERKITVPPLDLNKSMSSVSVPSADGSSALSYDGDEEKGGAEPSDPESDEHKSEDNFASAASSTGTFVIRRNSENKSSDGTVQKTGSTRNYCSSSEEEQENFHRDSLSTVARKPIVEDPVFTRKRPAKYFDDEDNDKSRSSTFSSIPNYVTDNISDHKASLAADTSGTSSRFSPVPITNFTTLAKSLTIEFTKKFCTTKHSTENKSDNVKSKGGGGSYDVRLSKDIPSSAEEANDNDDISNASDKENIDTSTNSKHVRKLSYTLATPSAALLEAVSKSKDNIFVQSLETVPSAPSSVGVQSAYQTPEKIATKEQEKKQASDVLDSIRVEEIVDSSKRGISTINVGHDGKQAHLERFLGEQKHLSKAVTTPDDSPQSIRVQEVQHLLEKMKQDHETQLRRMAEQYRFQELRIRQEFESEMEKLKEKFSSTLNTTDSNRSFNKVSPNSLVDSVNNSARSLSQTNVTRSETRSIALPLSLAEDITASTTASEQEQNSNISGQQVKNEVKDASVFHFTGGNSHNTIGDTQASTTVSYVNSSYGGPTELSGVGLSKLQGRMQLMSPRMFRTPADARSPLLKGLVYLDPLDKPVAPLRIPPKALEPHMKPKFDRISAAVKGFLTRRLLNTEKVQIIVQTIRDTVDLLLKLYEEVPASLEAPFVKTQDNELHQRLIQQLTGACRSFHDVFFKLSIKERMAIIATDREKLKAKALRALASPARPNISNATLKSIERRMSHRSSPKRDNRKSRKVHDPFQGSQSVKPKPIKTFNISPKRRRISYWDERNTVTRSNPTLSGKQDLNGNNFKIPSSKNHTSSSRTTLGQSRNYQVTGHGGMGDTFIVPPNNQTSRPLGLSTNSGVKPYMGTLSGRKDSITPSTAKSSSARSTQSSISVASASSGTNRSRTSTSRQPWNSGRT